MAKTILKTILFIALLAVIIIGVVKVTNYIVNSEHSHRGERTWFTNVSDFLKHNQEMTIDTSTRSIGKVRYPDESGSIRDELIKHLYSEFKSLNKGDLYSLTIDGEPQFEKYDYDEATVWFNKQIKQYEEQKVKDSKWYNKAVKLVTDLF